MIRKLDFRNPAYTKQDRNDFRALVKRYVGCDKWAKKGAGRLNKKGNVAVLLTAHPGGRAYLKASVETHKALGFWTCLSYDNYFDPARPDITWDSMMPSRDVMDNVDLFVMGHHQEWGGVLYPYFWLMKWGVSALQDFDYIFCSNGDCILEKPENFDDIMYLLNSGPYDIAVIGWEDNGGRPICNTTSFLARTHVIKAMMEHFEERFIPLKAYEASAQEIGNCEGRMGAAVIDLGIKVAPVDNPFNTQIHEPGIGTWCNVLGFRHIHAEWGYAYKHHLIPPPIKYIDQRHMGAGEYNAVKEYWDTGDENILKERWWQGGA